MHPELDPDPGWVALLSGTTRRGALRAVEEAAGERKLYRQLERAHQDGGRESYIEIDAPLELLALARLLRPRHVVEVGVSSGVSSAYLLTGMERNGYGTLHSVDLPSYPGRRRPGGKPPRMSWTLPPGRSPGWAVPFPLRKRWDLRLGDKADVLPLLTGELPCIDLLLYDVPHRDLVVRKELQSLDPLLRPGSVVIVDHGPGGELCTALQDWASHAGSQPAGRANLGLYGARKPRRPRRSA